MNVVLFHSTDTIPKYIEECVKQIKFYTPDSRIFLLTDKDIILRQQILEVVNIRDFGLNFDSLPYYKNDSMALWRTSALRFFYINEFLKRSKLQNVFHFDNDVLIYEDLKKIQSNIPLNGNFVITRHKEFEAVCGFVFIKNDEHLSKINDHLYNYMSKTERELENNFKSMPHEMRLLGQIFNDTPYIQDFPILPGWNNFESYNSVFDPSSYGQYICYNNNIHEGSKSRFIDKKILSNEITVRFDKQLKQPFLECNGQTIKINNLHIHCKNLKDYISYQ